MEQNHHTRLTKEAEELSERLNIQAMLKSKDENEKNEEISQCHIKIEELTEKLRYLERERLDLIK